MAEPPDGTPERGAPRDTGRPLASALTTPLSAGRLLTYLLCTATGVLVGLAGTLVQAAYFPGGLLLALAGAAGCFYGSARLTGNRAGVVLPLIGWLLGMWSLAVSRPEGDALLAPQAGSYLFIVGGALAGVVCTALLPPPGR